VEGLPLYLVRLVWLFLILVVLVLLPFAVWGDVFSGYFDLQNTSEVLIKPGRAWAWAVGVALLILDLILPIPGTMVMSALGFIYGPFAGGIVAGAGSLLSGLLAYGFCRMLGRPAARWIAGEKGLVRGELLFSGAAGGWLVALSRWLPVFPEVISCVAGLTLMPFRRFCLALACGTLPLGFAFAAIGHWGHEHPTFALVLSAGLPPLLWVILGPIVARDRESSGGIPK